MMIFASPLASAMVPSGAGAGGPLNHVVGPAVMISRSVCAG